MSAQDNLSGLQFVHADHGDISEIRAEHKGVPLGSIHYRYNEPSDWTPEVSVTMMHTNKESRGQGVATRLLQHLANSHPSVAVEDFTTSTFEHPAAAKAWRKVFGPDHPSLGSS